MANSWDFGGGVTSPRGGDPLGDQYAAPVTSSLGQGGFGGEPSGQPAPEPGSEASAPVMWLIAGVLAAVVAIGAAVATSSVYISIGAWALGGPVAIGFLAVFINADNSAQANPWYAESAVSDWGRRLLVLLALLAVGLNAWTIADHFARVVTF